MFKNRTNVVYKCTVRLLEDLDVLECEFQPNHRGTFLLDYVCEQLDIKDKDYFGLRYVDSAKQRHWLDLAKSITKQVKDVDPLVFSFRIKFYPADPFRLTGNAKFMLYQQLKRDLRHGRLYCSAGEASALGALVVQEELGDYDPEIHVGDYVAAIKIVLRQTDSLERKVMELHQKREPGQEVHIPIDEFMSIARTLETYGVDPHPVKDHRGSQLYLGINHSGINTFAAGKKAQHFRWSEIHKLNYEGKMFIAHLSYTDKESREPKKHTVGWKCGSGSACRYIWRCSIEQMLFFTLPNSQNASVMSGGGFMRGTKFRYSGRTEREILTESLNALRQQHLLNNTSPSKRKANSVPATPSSPQGDLAEIRYSSLPRSTMSEPMGCSNQINSGFLQDSTIPLLETVSEEARRQTGLENNGLSDYYFRDSFDHSSSESGFTSLTDNRIGHRLINPSHNPPLSITNQASSNNSAAVINQQNATNNAKTAKRFSILHAFVPSFIFVVIALIVLTIFILESESEMVSPIRDLPEMKILKYQYYQPLKDVFAKLFINQ
ncbi:FERM domain-containing protein 5 isoform X2 [Bradysia coprophila]|uniref:FERM domain-containing protein 5 isoform X2 n=1 Tax=Bradysia coprophila TaxID=38358 RepID=UPI00187D9A82|nr:FERM domain-containing protein 5 isoform X2 [Bradysia coprophila]